MNPALSLAGASVRAAGAVSPRTGAAIALPLFSRVESPRPVSVDDEPTMERARRGTLRTAGVDGRGVDVAVYEWGRGDRTIVLAHGWNGRASQFSAVVRELVAEGCHVVAFDAPAHGASGGRRTYLIDWIEILAALQRVHGRFEAVIGHSFGGLATLVGVAGGVEADRVVTVAAPAEADSLLSQFQTILGFSDRVGVSLRERFAAHYFPGDPDPFAWLSALRRPLPAGTPLLVVHDERDGMVPFGEAPRIAAANADARLLATIGLGHTRILSSDLLLDAVLGFVASGHPSMAAREPAPVAR